MIDGSSCFASSMMPKSRREECVGGGGGDGSRVGGVVDGRSDAADGGIGGEGEEAEDRWEVRGWGRRRSD